MILYGFRTRLSHFFRDFDGPVGANFTPYEDPYADADDVDPYRTRTATRTEPRSVRFRVRFPPTGRNPESAKNVGTRSVTRTAPRGPETDLAVPVLVRVLYRSREPVQKRPETSPKTDRDRDPYSTRTGPVQKRVEAPVQQP